MTTVPYSPATKTFSIKQESFFDQVKYWLEPDGVDWDLVSDDVMETGIDLYFGPEADTDFFFEAIEDLDGHDYAQAIVNMARNDRDTLSAANAFQTIIQKALKAWMISHVDAHVPPYDPNESVENY